MTDIQVFACFVPNIGVLICTNTTCFVISMNCILTDSSPYCTCSLCGAEWAGHFAYNVAMAWNWWHHVKETCVTNTS